LRSIDATVNLGGAGSRALVVRARAVEVCGPLGSVPWTISPRPGGHARPHLGRAWRPRRPARVDALGVNTAITSGVRRSFPTRNSPWASPWAGKRTQLTARIVALITPANRWLLSVERLTSFPRSLPWPVSPCGKAFHTECGDPRTCAS